MSASAKVNQQIFANIFETQIYLIRHHWFSWKEIQLMSYFDFLTYSKSIIKQQQEADKRISGQE